MTGGAGKDFGAIETDYDFFMAHSTEAEADLKAYREIVADLSASGSPLCMLDFGCGNGDFTEKFLKQAAWAPEQLRLSLVEPVEAQRCETAERLQPFTRFPIVHGPNLGSCDFGRFDLILVNHVLYYVTDLGETLDELYRSLKPGGLLLIAMAGRSNAMFRFWQRTFDEIGKPIPYHVSEDLDTVLKKSDLRYSKEIVPYSIVFDDTEENRMKLLRFLLADHLTEALIPALVQEFEPLVRDNKIEMHTESSHYTIRK